MSTMKQQPIKNPFPVPIRPLRLRRIRRVLTTISTFFLVCAIVLASAKFGYWAMASLIVSTALGIALQFATRNLSNSTNIITDERERQMRDHAHRISYWVMAGVLGAIFGWTVGFLIDQDPRKPVMLIQDFFKLETQVLFFSFWTIFLGLPTAFIAWLEPDLLKDDRKN